MHNYSFKVLVVEDEADFQDLLIEEFLAKGIESFGASNGKEALDLLRRQAFDVVVSDVRMPELDGLELARTVSQEFPYISIIMMSGNAEKTETLHALKLPIFDFVEKPFDIELLSDIVIAAGKTAMIKQQKQHSQKLIEELKKKSS